MAALVAAGRPAGRPSGRRAAAFSKGGRVAALFCVSAGRRQTGEVVTMATSTVAERLDSAALEIAGAWLAKREADVADVERVYAHIPVKTYRQLAVLPRNKGAMYASKVWAGLVAQCARVSLFRCVIA